MTFLIFLLLIGLIHCQYFEFSDRGIIQSNCSRTCILGEEYWVTHGIKEWPRECYTMTGDKFDPTRMRFSDGLRWTGAFYTNTDDFRKYFVSSVLDMCNGACFDRPLVKTIDYFHNYYRENTALPGENQLVNLVKSYSRGDNGYISKCKQCTENDCRITPLLQSSRHYFGKTIAFWGVNSNEQNKVLFIRNGVNSDISNFISGNYKQIQPHFFPPGYSKDYHVSVFDNSIDSVSWKLGIKKSTFLQLSNSEEESDRYRKDCNNNTISDVCEKLFDGNNCNEAEIPDSCFLTRDKNRNTFCNAIKTPFNCNRPLGLEELNLIDCNMNNIDDEVEIVLFNTLDLNGDGIIDECKVYGTCVTASIATQGSCIDGLNKFECTLIRRGKFLIDTTCEEIIATPTTEEPEPEPTKQQEPPPTKEQEIPPTQEPTRPPPSSTKQPESTAQEEETYGSCYLEKNVVKCINTVTTEHCTYLNGVFSGQTCETRSDMDKKNVGKIESVHHIDVSEGNKPLSTQELLIVISVPVYVFVILLVTTIIYTVFLKIGF